MYRKTQYVMKKRKLSFYTRRKINHRFVQGSFLKPRGFVKLLEKHGIKINEKTLEKYESEGWVRPAFRIIIPKRLQNGGLSLGNDAIKEFYKDKLIEFPKNGDYEPWSNFKADYKKGERHDKKLIRYHFFQILQIKNILRYKEFRFTYFDSYKKPDLEKITANIKKSNRTHVEQFNTSLFEQINTIGLLMLLEEPYRYQAFGSMQFSVYRNDNDSFKSWMRWKKKFSAEKLLKDSGLSVEQVLTLHRGFTTQVNFLDPLKKWYDLIRIMKLAKIKELRGDALTAQLYYNIINMIALFLYDLTGERVQDPDSFFDGRNGEWKKDVYSNQFDYGTRKTQRGILRRFVEEPTARLYLLVEGVTEEKVIGEIFKRWDIDIEEDGIIVMNYTGVGNIRKKNLNLVLKAANRDYIPVYVIADNEITLKSIQNIQEVTTQFAYHIWNKSFEEDNFGRKKVVELINSYLKPHGQTLSRTEIETQLRSKKALVKSIECTYNSKYHKKLYDTIGKSKPDISLDLMAPRLEKISSGKQIDKQTKIEKVLKKAFKMIPT